MAYGKKGASPGWLAAIITSVASVIFLFIGALHAQTPPAKKAGESAIQALEAATKKVASEKTLKFKPSYITIPKHRQISPEDWTDPAVCGQCHSRQYEGWKGSMHANAFKDPIFQALWAIGEKATNGRFKNHCSGCHTPIGTINGTVKFDPKKGKHGGFTADPIAEKGVSCDVCHSITGTNFNRTAVLEHGNASFSIDPGATKRGSLKNSKSPYHKTEYSKLHTSAQFCGNCHNIFHPENNFPIERTYDEWKYSIYAQKGIQCQDCHMVPVKVARRVADELKKPKNLDKAGIGGLAAVGGPYRKIVHDHYFVGGNAVITSALQGQKSKNYQQAVERLQSAASLKIKVKPRGFGLHELKVRVTNERAGHNLPTSLTEVRQIWLDVSVKDDKGRDLFHSGALDPKTNELPPETVIFNAHAVNAKGEHTTYPWEVTRFVDVNTIPPKGYKYGKYSFAIPADAKKVFVTAKLNYRSFNQGMADLLLGKGKIKVPHINMNTETASFDVKDGKILAGKTTEAKH